MPSLASPARQQLVVDNSWKASNYMLKLHFQTQHLNIQANKSKMIFTKYVDSVLAKCAKIKNLIADLKKNYDDPLAGSYLASFVYTRIV